MVSERRTPRIRWKTEPRYVVVFASSADLTDAYSPIVDWSVQRAVQDGTVPHGFDRDLVPYLPALWYCLHLPNTLFELEDLPAGFLKDRQAYDFAHDIVLIPHAVFRDYIGRLLEHGAQARAVIIFTADNLAADVRDAAQELEQPVLVLPTASLGGDLIAEHWRFVHRAFPRDATYLGREPSLVDRLDSAPLVLPTELLRRQFGAEGRVGPPATQEQLEALGFYAIHSQTILSTTARLEKEQRTPEEAEQLFAQAQEEERQRLSLPVCISAPGVPPSYRRNAYGQDARLPREQDWPVVDPSDTWSGLRTDPDDLHAERAAVEFLATHRAIARTGLAFPLGPVDPSMFQLLARLENHCATTTPKPRAVWRWLDEIGSGLVAMMDDSAITAVSHASFLNVFSNYPIGLTILPGDSAPLCCRVPIAYRPLLPLTRALQVELMSPSIYYVGSGLRVLVAECIDSTDPVGRLSRIGWEFIREHNGSDSNIDVQYVDVRSVPDLQAALREGQPHALILSAHGFYEPAANAAGVVIGREPHLGTALGEMPPLVLLSACHVAPRGVGVVPIADLLLREGAVAVLGTQVPVDVRHNAHLMSRFLTCVGEAFAGREPHRTVAEIWHRTAVSNAIIDVLHGSQSLHEWGGSRFEDSTVLQTFMMKRSSGKLHLGSIYKDTEQVLLEMAAEMGMQEKVHRWLQDPGYMPESLFYTFIGWPERIVIQDRYLSQHAYVESP